MQDALALSTNLIYPQSDWPAEAGLFYAIAKSLKTFTAETQSTQRKTPSDIGFIMFE